MQVTNPNRKKLERCLYKLIYNKSEPKILWLIKDIEYKRDRYWFVCWRLTDNTEMKMHASSLLNTDNVVWLGFDVCKEGLQGWSDAPVKVPYTHEG